MKFKFKKNASVVSTEPHYDLFSGGYIKPEALLADEEQAAKVRDAVETVRQFLDQAESAGVLELY